VFFAGFLAYLVFVVSADAFMHSLLQNISGFADLGRFQFSLQEFKKANSGTEVVGEVDKRKSPSKKEFFKDKNFEIVR